MKLLATDLDRTLLPNGKAPDDNMLPKLGELLSAHNIIPIFVTARRVSNVIHSVFNRYNPPKPSSIIGAVGAEIYHLVDGVYQEDTNWYDVIMENSPLWNRTMLYNALETIGSLRLQEDREQTPFKLSYYIDSLSHFDKCVSKVQKIVSQIAGESAMVTASRDLNAEIGYCDITPTAVTKRSALEYLLSMNNIPHSSVLYAGDSGNDLPVIVSPFDAILVANAEEEVKEYALKFKEKGSLFIAKGINGLNGNYCSGIIEGLIAKNWIPNSTGIRN